jgi:hypothetical protein
MVDVALLLARVNIHTFRTRHDTTHIRHDTRTQASTLSSGAVLPLSQLCSTSRFGTTTAT